MALRPSPHPPHVLDCFHQYLRNAGNEPAFLLDLGFGRFTSDSPQGLSSYSKCTLFPCDR